MRERVRRRASAFRLLAVGVLCVGSPAAAERSSGRPVEPKEAAAVGEGTPEGGGVEALPGPAVRVAQAEADSQAAHKGLLSAESGQPLSIKADELEAVEEGGQRRLRFTRGVHVQQGELSVRSDRLEAFYPKDAEQPERLVASGHVRVKRLDRQLACDAATYYQTEERLVCNGHAELREGEDRVRGEQIEIFFRDNRVRVSGGAVVNVTPERKKAPAETKPVSAGPGAAGVGAGR